MISAGTEDSKAILLAGDGAGSEIHTRGRRATEVGLDKTRTNLGMIWVLLDKGYF